MKDEWNHVMIFKILTVRKATEAVNVRKTRKKYMLEGESNP